MPTEQSHAVADQAAEQQPTENTKALFYVVLVVSKRSLKGEKGFDA